MDPNSNNKQSSVDLEGFAPAVASGIPSATVAAAAVAVAAPLEGLYRRKFVEDFSFSSSRAARVWE